MTLFGLQILWQCLRTYLSKTQGTWYCKVCFRVCIEGFYFKIWIKHNNLSSGRPWSEHIKITCFLSNTLYIGMYVANFNVGVQVVKSDVVGLAPHFTTTCVQRQHRYFTIKGCYATLNTLLRCQCQCIRMKSLKSGFIFFPRRANRALRCHFDRAGKLAEVHLEPSIHLWGGFLQGCQICIGPNIPN
jgi:hypothetical protein